MKKFENKDKSSIKKSGDVKQDSARSYESTLKKALPSSSSSSSRWQDSK